MRRLLVLLLVAAAAALTLRGDVPCGPVPFQPGCYVALTPGPTENALQLVRIAGETTYASGGALLVTTVGVDPFVDPLEWVRHAFSDRVAQVPRETIYPPGQTVEDVTRRNRVQMESSQLDAALAALRYLGRDVAAASRGAEVLEVVAGSPADGRLQPGDVLVTVAGADVDSAEEAVAALRRRDVGERVLLTVRRGGAREDVVIELGQSPDEPGRPFVGVLLQTDVHLPLDLEIDAGAIGGPSAGLMFALAIVDLLGPEDLTGGVVIAGTGTIDRDGRVGAVGGIRQKILGSLSRDEPAAVFLVPDGADASNFDEARSTPAGREILLVPVGSLEDAVRALRMLREGERPVGAYALAPGR